jgi:hypothetical protein
MLIPKISIGLVSNHVLTTGFWPERNVSCPKWRVGQRRYFFIFFLSIWMLFIISYLIAL